MLILLPLNRLWTEPSCKGPQAPAGCQLTAENRLSAKPVLARSLGLCAGGMGGQMYKIVAASLSVTGGVLLS